jgi:hypothetical protein
MPQKISQQQDQKHVSQFEDLSPPLCAWLNEITNQLTTIEFALAGLVQHRGSKEWYTTADVAEILTKAEYTVREWCRQGRIDAKKKACGRGKSGEWLISHAELNRVKNEGILSVDHGV